MGKSLCGAFAGADPGDAYAWRPPELGCSTATPSRCLYVGSQLPKSVLSLRRLVVNGTLAAAAFAGTLPAALADPSLNLRRLLVRDASALSGTLAPPSRGAARPASPDADGPDDISNTGST